MNTALAHRGPDGEGMAIYPHAALGHRRLAIIDVSAGGQPMKSDNGLVCLTFNGEIYNYQELRRHLQHQGACFHTYSDTEVILQLFIQEGIAGFRRLRGMFAFVIWDEGHRQGILVRDPLGIKPLFYRYRPGLELFFASEAKAILAADGGNGQLDEASLHLLLNFRYLPGQRSLLQGINQLPAGGLLTWNSQGILQESSLPMDQIGDCDSSSSLADNTHLEALRETVQTHCVADVEVGCYLSGGIDSALVTRLAGQSSPYKPRTFTLKVGDDPNEATNASQSAQLLGVQNIQGELPVSLENFLGPLIWHLEVPKVNALQNYILASMTAHHVKVVLSGLGGDELFLGYNAHRIMHLSERVHGFWFLPGFFRQPLAIVGQRLTQLTGPVWNEPGRACHMLENLGNWPYVYGLLRNVWDRPTLRQMIYGPRLLDAQLPNAFEVLESLWPNTDNPVRATAIFEWREKMVNDLLWQEDRCSMAHGLEVRVPFVDRVLLSHIGRLSRNTLMPGGRPKGYLRELAAQVLPREILQRPKSGFQINAADFFSTTLMPMARVWLNHERIQRWGLFNPQFVRRVMAYKPSPALRWHYFMLFLMISSHYWLELFENQQYELKNHALSVP